jgi:hypothetical protein
MLIILGEIATNWVLCWMVSSLYGYIAGLAFSINNNVRVFSIFGLPGSNINGRSATDSLTMTLTNSNHTHKINMIPIILYFLNHHCISSSIPYNKSSKSYTYINYIPIIRHQIIIKIKSPTQPSSPTSLLKQCVT